MTDFSNWKEFDYFHSTVQLWVFKKSTTDAKFKAWHVKTDSIIENLFLDAVKNDLTQISETIAYGPLSQNNENSCLIHSLAESDGLKALIAAANTPVAESTDAKLQHLKGAAGYLVKFQNSDSTVFAVRKTAPTWKPKIRSSFINAIFINGELSVTPTETFSFDSKFDFYCLNETVFVKSKRAYESTMSEKKVYEKNFDSLVTEAGFTQIFSDIEPLKTYIGKNSIQLKRITVIQTKALYLREDFLDKLKRVNESRGFGLNFSLDGKLVVCANTAKTIMQILLDHRLLSEITETIYDVPDAEAI